MSAALDYGCQLVLIAWRRKFRSIDLVQGLGTPAVHGERTAITVVAEGVPVET